MSCAKCELAMFEVKRLRRIHLAAIQNLYASSGITIETLYRELRGSVDDAWHNYEAAFNSLRLHKQTHGVRTAENATKACESQTHYGAP